MQTPSLTTQQSKPSSFTPKGGIADYKIDKKNAMANNNGNDDGDGDDGIITKYEVHALWEMFKVWYFANETHCVDFRDMYQRLGNKGLLKKEYMNKLISDLAWNINKEYVIDENGGICRITISAWIDWAHHMATRKSQDIVNEWTSFVDQQDLRNARSYDDPCIIPGIMLPPNIAEKFFKRWDEFLRREEIRRDLAFAADERRRDEMFRIEFDHRICAHSSTIYHYGNEQLTPIPQMQMQMPIPQGYVPQMVTQQQPLQPLPQTRQHSKHTVQ